MSEEDFMKIHAALFATATDDEGNVAKDDDDAEIYTYNDEDYYDENEYEDREYDDWIENTYWLGDSDDTSIFKDMIDKLNEAIDRLEQTVNYMENDDHRYYSDVYNNLEQLANQTEGLVSSVLTNARAIEEVAGDYSTW